MFFFDAFVHPSVIEAGAKDLRCKSHLSASVLRRLETREQFSLTFDQGDFDYYETYKGFQGQTEPASMFIEAAADPEEYSKFINRNSPEGAQAKDQFDGIKDLVLKKEINKEPEIFTKPNVQLFKEENVELKQEKIRNCGIVVNGE
jgi:hypothetical protein